ncbi:CHASE2 domain-containing protein [Polycladidibacter stylochi]|uniref:CHASE2 domain-containing protein n=1 Tax=Polycladidibacter stylochi TaxID=1807766 RepID=UPI00082CBA16|nr:CHASE2 domain-containing protein [Pseudovibrio stylochi]
MAEPGRILHERRALATILASVVIVILALLRLTNPHISDNFTNFSLGFYEWVWPREVAGQHTLTVLLDETDAHANIIKAYTPVDWPRTRLASLVERIGKAGAKTIALDVDLTDIDPTSPRAHISDYISQFDKAEKPGSHYLIAETLTRLPDHDAILARTIAKYPVVLSAQPDIVKQTTAERYPKLPFTPLAENASAIAYNSLNVDGSAQLQNPWLYAYDVNRKAPGYMSLAAASLTVAGLTRAPDLQLSQDGLMLLHRPKNSQVNLVGQREIETADRQVLKPLINGALVFVGTSARATAKHALAAEQAIQGATLSRQPWTGRLEFMATLALALVFLIATSNYGISSGFYVGIGSSFFFIALCIYQFANAHVVLDPLYPCFAALVSFVVWALVYSLTLNRDRNLLVSAFKGSLGAGNMPELLEEPEQAKLEGMERRLSFLNAKLDGFRSLYDRLSAEELISVSRTFIDAQSQLMMQNHATINRMGRGQITGFWNAPLFQPDHGSCACRAALAMQELMQTYHDRDRFHLVARGFNNIDMPLRISICTGRAKIGNIGNRNKFRYAALGNCVDDTDSLLLHCAKAGANILVCPRTVEEATEFAFLETVPVTENTPKPHQRVYALLGDSALAFSEDFLELKLIHRKMIDALEARNLKQAEIQLSRCRNRATLKMDPVYDAFEAQIAKLDAYGALEQGLAAE